MPDEFDEVDEEQERREHERTLRKFKHLDVNVRMAEMEALEKQFEKAGKGAMKNKNTKNRVAKDFLEKYRGDQKPDQNLIDFLRKTAGGAGQGGVSNEDYEPGHPTGIQEAEGDLPWDQEDD